MTTKKNVVDFAFRSCQAVSWRICNAYASPPTNRTEPHNIADIAQQWYAYFMLAISRLAVIRTVDTIYGTCVRFLPVLQLFLRTYKALVVSSRTLKLHS